MTLLFLIQIFEFLRNYDFKKNTSSAIIEYKMWRKNYVKRIAE